MPLFRGRREDGGTKYRLTQRALETSQRYRDVTRPRVTASVASIRSHRPLTQGRGRA